MAQVYETAYKPLYGGKVRREYRRFQDENNYTVIPKKEFDKQQGIKMEFGKGYRMAELQAKTLSGLIHLTSDEHTELDNLYSEFCQYLESFEKLFAD